jgi:hypothetical protein
MLAQTAVKMARSPLFRFHPVQRSARLATQTINIDSQSGCAGARQSYRLAPRCSYLACTVPKAVRGGHHRELSLRASPLRLRVPPAPHRWRARMTLMSKCAMGDCNRKPVGGVEEILEAGNHTALRAIVPGRKTAWCAEHERALKSNFPYRRWRTLNKRELES